MIEKSLSVTKAARVLGVSVPTVKRMAADGELQFFRTPGGHLRVAAESVERLREGNTKEARHREPSSVLKNRREHVEELGLEAQELRSQRELSKLRKEAAEEAERERQDLARREREQRREGERTQLEQERRDQEQEEAKQLQREAEQHRKWRDGWLTEALKLIPRDCPKEYYGGVCQEVEKTLDRLDPGCAQYVIREVVASAVERGLHSWRRRKTVEDAIEKAEDCLPFWAKSFSSSPWWKCIGGMIFEEGSCGAEGEAAQWRHGNGNTKTTGTARRVVDRDSGVAAVWGASILRAVEQTAGGGRV